MNEQQFIDILQKYWGLISVIGAFLIGVAWLKLDTRYAKKSDINHDIARLREGQDDMSERLDVVEQEIKHLPSADDVTNLRIAVEEMKGETRALHATTKGLNRLVDLLVENEVKDK